MATRVELHQFDCLKEGHVKKQLVPGVDIFDPRHSGALMMSVGGAVYGFLRDRIGHNVPVLFAVKMGQASEGQVPYHISS